MATRSLASRGSHLARVSHGYDSHGSADCSRLSSCCRLSVPCPLAALSRRTGTRSAVPHPGRWQCGGTPADSDRPRTEDGPGGTHIYMYMSHQHAATMQTASAHTPMPIAPDSRVKTIRSAARVVCPLQLKRRADVNREVHLKHQPRGGASRRLLPASLSCTACLDRAEPPR